MVIEMSNIDVDIDNGEPNIAITQREATVNEPKWSERICTFMYVLLVDCLVQKPKFAIINIPRYDNNNVNPNLNGVFSFFHPSTYLIERVTIECQEEAEILHIQNNEVNKQEANLKYDFNLSHRGMTSHCKRGKQKKRYVWCLWLLILLNQTNGHAISPEAYEMKWNLPIKEEQMSLTMFMNSMNINIGTYDNNELKETMLYTDRLKLEVNTIDNGNEQIKLSILYPRETDLIDDYTADVYLNTGKLLQGIQPDYNVQLKPYTSRVITSEGNVAKLVWILQDNRLPSRIIISRENKSYHIRQFVAEWTEGNCLNPEQCDVDLTSTPDAGEIIQMVTLSIPTITSADFDFIFYCQVFTPGEMSMKSDIQLVHEGCTCPPGEFVTSKCTTSKTVRCRKCQYGTFNMNRDESTSCTDCKPACGSKSHVLHHCNSTSDLKCECKPGFKIRPDKLETACFSVEDTTTATEATMVTQTTIISIDDKRKFESLRDYIAPIVIAVTMMVVGLLCYAHQRWRRRKADMTFINQNDAKHEEENINMM